jgi:hypothetical protein
MLRPTKTSNRRPQKSVHGATRKTLNKIKGMSGLKVEKIKEATAKCQVGVYPLRPNFAKLQLVTEVCVR